MNINLSTSNQSSRQLLLQQQSVTSSSFIQQLPLRKRKYRRQYQHQDSNCRSSGTQNQMKMLFQGCSMWWWVQRFLLTQFLMVIVQAGWIDIDTPIDKRTTISKIDGTIYQLVRIGEKKESDCGGGAILRPCYYS